ncbi:MAG: M57 family metalloprotease, partial [Bacteroidota bacterium]
MINLRRVAASAVAIAMGSFLMVSCVQDETTTPEDHIPDNVASTIQSAGLSVEDLVVKTEDVNPFDGVDAPEKVYYAEGDIRFTEADLEQMAQNVDGEVIELPTGEQYRTSNLVSVSGSTRTISVIGYTGSGFALTSRMRTGLQWAINNYNRENLRLRFTLSFAASTNADIVVYNNGASGGGGSAGFPTGGNPFKWVQINAGTQSF